MKIKIQCLFVLLLGLLTACHTKEPDGNSNGETIVRLELQQTFGGRKFNQPVAMLQAPGENDAWYIVERGGRVYRSSSNSASDAELFADLSDRVNAGFSESGLLSMAFHPDYSNNHFIYFAYTGTANPLVSKVSRFTVNDDGKSINKETEQNILSVNNQYDKHNISQIAFGPDRYLYVGFGDGHEGGGDPLKHGQNTNTLMAAILRIDVDKEVPYAIPSDNPFADGKGGKPEIYAWGFRNPWRWSFDRDSGNLWVADVGEYHWEEVNSVKKGGNYGWPIREGKHCYGSKMECIKQWLCLWNCPATDLVDPVVDYSHEEGCAVIGGYVYHGQSFPALQGVYLFSDACSGTIWGLIRTNRGYERRTLYTVDEHKRTEGFLTVSFAESNNGEIYVVHYNGSMHQVVAGIGE
jgi:glucose/arabinose dehydrogenase